MTVAIEDLDLTSLEGRFVTLVGMGEVHPHEHQIPAYVKQCLRAAGVRYREDDFGNIIAYLPGGPGRTLALVAHMDIAKPFTATRRLVGDDLTIHTDGTGLLGGDDLTAVAVLLELVAEVSAGRVRLARPLELVFTRGEEAGCVGAMNLDMSLISAREALVFDWEGPVGTIITSAPAYAKLDVIYRGVSGHPAKRADCVDAGEALIQVLAELTRSDFGPGIIRNVGRVDIGEARNVIPGSGLALVEFRGHDTDGVITLVHEVGERFRTEAKARGVRHEVTIPQVVPAYLLSHTGELIESVLLALEAIKQAPKLVSTNACFDGNPLAARGIETVITGAAYRKPHGEFELVDRQDFADLFWFVVQMATTAAA